MTDHNEITAREFTRQAPTFAAAPAMTETALTTRIIEAAGPAACGAVLDLACGPGILTAALAERAESVTGFDLTEAMLTAAADRCAAAGRTNVTFRQGDAADLPFADGAFDCVITRLSVHHFSDPAQVLAEAYRVTKTGGTLVLADIVSSADPRAAALHNALEILRDPSHVRMLPPAELVALIAGAGFRVVAQSGWEQKRTFDEWTKIVDSADRVAPLRTVFAALARIGEPAGIGLAADGDGFTFTHRWLLVTAVR